MRFWELEIRRVAANPAATRRKQHLESARPLISTDSGRSVDTLYRLYQDAFRKRNSTDFGQTRMMSSQRLEKPHFRERSAFRAACTRSGSPQLLGQGAHGQDRRKQDVRWRRVPQHPFSLHARRAEGEPSVGRPHRKDQRKKEATGQIAHEAALLGLKHRSRFGRPHG
jgi:hypothetical protein